MPQTLANGSLLNNRFRIRRLLSDGPLGAVYLVDDIRITEKAWTAREYLPFPTSPKEKIAAEEEFHHQVETVKNFHHPNLIRVLDSFSEGNRNYLITEYVDGLTLEAIVKLTQNSLSEKQVLEWALQMCDPLEYLHGLPSPFYMKDLGPQYFIVNRDGKILVGGYGLDLIFGKFYKISSSFTAPELKDSDKGSMSGDIYSLAGCLYFLLTKKKPSIPLQPLRNFNTQLSDSFCQLIETCLNPDPSKRYINVLDLQDRFFKILYPPAAPLPSKQPAKSPLRSFSSSHISAAKIKSIPKFYYVVSLILIFVGLFFAFHPSPKYGVFEKTGPAAYILNQTNTQVVDLTKFALADEIPKAGGGVAAQPLFKGKEIILAKFGGSLLLINSHNDHLILQYLLRQKIGGMAVSGNGKHPAVYLTLPQKDLLEVLRIRRSKLSSKVEIIPVTIVPLGKKPEKIVYNPNQNELYIANTGSNSISVVDAQKYLVKKSLSLPKSPENMAVSQGGKWLFIVYKHSDRLDQYRTADFSLVNSIHFGFSGPYALASFGKKILVAANKGNRLEIYEVSSLSKERDIPVDHPEAAIFLSHANEILVGSSSGILSLFNEENGNLIDRIDIAKNPSYILPAP